MAAGGGGQRACPPCLQHLIHVSYYHALQAQAAKSQAGGGSAPCVSATGRLVQHRRSPCLPPASTARRHRRAEPCLPCLYPLAVTRRLPRCSSATTRSWGRRTRWAPRVRRLRAAAAPRASPAPPMLLLPGLLSLQTLVPALPPACLCCTHSLCCLLPARRQVIIDTNFINFSIRNKIDLVKARGAHSQGSGNASGRDCFSRFATESAWSRVEGLIIYG